MTTVHANTITNRSRTFTAAQRSRTPYYVEGGCVSGHAWLTNREGGPQPAMALIEAHEATIQTAAVEIRTLTVAGRGFDRVQLGRSKVWTWLGFSVAATGDE